jgi:hypothetical protein
LTLIGQSGPEGRRREVVETHERKPSFSRQANDRIYEALSGFAADRGDFLCECTRSSCMEEVPMALSEYVRLRDRDEFIYASGHDGAGTP